MTDPVTEAKSMSEWQRIVGIFWEPRPVFEDLAVRPRWWVPLILMTVLAVGYVSTFSRLVGWESFMRQQIQSNTRTQQLSVEQQERIIQQQVKFASVAGYGGSVVGVAVSTLLIAAVLLGVFNLLGGTRLLYKQAFSITCYSFLPTALSTIMAWVVMLLKDPSDFDLQNPHVLNVGAFLDPNTTAKWVHSLASSVDAFSIWVMLLLAIGFSAAAKNLRFAKSLTLVLSAWVVFVGLKSAWAGLFG